MLTYRRYSPVAFDRKPAETERRGDWLVVLRYENEGNGPHLIDLSHREKWDVQSGDLSKVPVARGAIPAIPGRVSVEGGLLASRMNRTQAALWRLWGESVEAPQEPAYTETTDGIALLALVGKGVFSILEKACPLDLAPPGESAPYLVQGPVFHIPCQIVVLEKDPDAGGVLIGFSRGYGQAMAEAFLEAGAESGLSPAGEAAFADWVKGYSKACNT